MEILKVHQELVNMQNAKILCELCTFHAITYSEADLEIGAGCRMCRLCVKNGPPGVITCESAHETLVDKTKWSGITVFAEWDKGRIHPVAYELIGKAKSLASVNQEKVYVLLAGNCLENAAEELLHYGADCVFCYEQDMLEEFRPLLYTNVVEDFVAKIHPSVILFGATAKGRSLAPRAAARFRTGLTADCTVLEMRENTDIVQIRPAFGGNIMAQIITANSRPQFCTVRYKIFSAPERSNKTAGIIEWMKLPEDRLVSTMKIMKRIEKPKEVDISDAEVVIAVGRGVRSQKDLRMAQLLADILHAQLACTRPLIEAGWFDAKHQIGLSGRTVKPKLLITLGISGSVQFVAGMKGADCIIAVNLDKRAHIFDVAHYGFVGDIYEVLPHMLEKLRGGTI